MQTSRSPSTETRAYTGHQQHEVRRPELFNLKYYMLLHSVLGIISIPRMMTGATLGGSAQQAAKLQMIMMFMITASTTLASVFITFAAIFVLVEQEHPVRPDRIEVNGQQWFNICQWYLKKVVRWFRIDFQWRLDKHNGSDSQRELLIV